jgi:hypothetical protein
VLGVCREILGMCQSPFSKGGPAVEGVEERERASEPMRARERMVSACVTDAR